MCGRFQGVPIEIVEQILRDIETQNTATLLPDWPAVYPSIYPKSKAAVITLDKSRDEPQTFDRGADCTYSLSAELMVWGYEVSWSKNVIFNTRADSALKLEPSNMWRDSLAERRCVIPTTGFYEPHRSETFINPKSGKANKQHYLFTLPNQPFLFLAGIFKGGHFSVMTTDPNSSVSPIHDRMPVALAQTEISKWLCGEYASLFDRSSLTLDCVRVEHQ